MTSYPARVPCWYSTPPICGFWSSCVSNLASSWLRAWIGSKFWSFRTSWTVCWTRARNEGGNHGNRTIRLGLGCPACTRHRSCRPPVGCLGVFLPHTAHFFRGRLRNRGGRYRHFRCRRVRRRLRRRANFCLMSVLCRNSPRRITVSLSSPACCRCMANPVTWAPGSSFRRSGWTWLAARIRSFRRMVKGTCRCTTARPRSKSWRARFSLQGIKGFFRLPKT